MRGPGSRWRVSLWLALALCGAAVGVWGVFWWLEDAPGPAEIVVPSPESRDGGVSSIIGRTIAGAPIDLLGPEQQPISDVAVVPAVSAGDRVRDDELVLGIELDGQSRAYPINMIHGPTREVFNDELGGRPIVVTWCALCADAVVFDREIEGRDLKFGLSGLLWKGNLVLYDQETRSYWSQLLGQAIAGPLAGRELRLVPSVLTDWKSWRDRHPESTVIALDRSATIYGRGVYSPLSDFVLGAVLAGRARAWSLAALAQQPVRMETWQDRPVLLTYDRESGTARLFDRTVEEKALDFQVDPERGLIDLQTKSVWGPIAGRASDGPSKGTKLMPIPTHIAFRRAWLAIHPNSEVVD